MALVGDLILGLRELAPDPCQTLQSPGLTANFQLTAPTLFAAGATAYLKATQGTQWGESAASVETTVTNAASFNVSGTIACSALATFVRVYFTSVGAGAEDTYVEFPISSPTNSVSFIVTTTSTMGFNVPPTISRAYLPDSDGNILSASLVYRWLNEGLNLTGQLTGGIRDVTGVPTTQGVAQYTLAGQWAKIDNQFFDGYPFAAGTKQQIYRHGPVQGLTGVGTVNTSSDRQLIELWPQPDRTSGSGIINGAITATATTIPAIFGANGFVLGFGLILIGTYPPTSLVGPNSCELIYYSTLNSNSITNITRGLGGTQPQAWPAATPFYEVNAYLTGFRMPQLYQKGQASFTFTCPPAFEDAIRTYLTHRFKLAEQDQSGAKAEFDRFKEICSSIKAMRQVMGPRQLQVGGSGGVETAVGLGSPFGGVIIP